MSNVSYYYLRDQHNNPRGCVAIEKNADGTVNRGISICSELDRFDRACARGIALQRLNIAKRDEKNVEFNKYNGECSGGVRHMPVWDLTHTDVADKMDIGNLITFKCTFRDQPTQFEKRMLEKPATI